MIKVEITGFNTAIEAREFVDWYEGQGEQDAAAWFEERVNEGVMHTGFMGLCKKPVWDGDTLKVQLVMS